MDKQVNPVLYGDNKTRIFTFWTVRVLIFDLHASTSLFILFLFLKEYLFFLSWLQTDSYKKIGCYNLLCPGFVQVDNRIALGACLSRISVYGGNQYELNFNVWKVEQYFYLITVSNTSNLWIHMHNHIICNFCFSGKNS